MVDAAVALLDAPSRRAALSQAASRLYARSLPRRPRARGPAERARCLIPGRAGSPSSTGRDGTQEASRRTWTSCSRRWPTVAARWRCGPSRTARAIALPLDVPAGASRWCAATDGVDASVAALSSGPRRCCSLTAWLTRPSRRGCLAWPRRCSSLIPTPEPVSAVARHWSFRAHSPATAGSDRRVWRCSTRRRCGGLSPVTMVKDYRRQRRQLGASARMQAS